MQKSLIIFILALSIFSCRKDKKEVIPEETESIQMTLVDSLVGTYEGIYTRKKEVFDCYPDCYPPCDQTLTYDTNFITIEIQKINNDSVKIIDNMFEEVNSQFYVDSSLSYEGGSQSINSTIDLSELKVFWKGEHHDSLYIEHNRGNGGSCGGTYYYDNYSLEK